jgi:hypothetical protein
VPDFPLESKQLDRAVMIRLWGLDDGGDQIAPERGGVGGALRDGGRSDFQEPLSWIGEVAELLSFSTLMGVPTRQALQRRWGRIV